VFSRENIATANFREVAKLPNYTKDYKDIDEPIAKILFADVKEESFQRLEECLHAHPRANEFAFVRSEKHLYEILPKGTHKGVVIEKLSEILGIKMSNTIGIGDYFNDIGMVRTAGLGVAVSNATPELKEIADVITVSNNEHAIAKVIYQIADGTIVL